MYWCNMLVVTRGRGGGGRGMGVEGTDVLEIKVYYHGTQTYAWDHFALYKEFPDQIL